jgi:hypothetical protein
MRARRQILPSLQCLTHDAVGTDLLNRGGYCRRTSFAACDGEHRDWSRLARCRWLLMPTTVWWGPGSAGFGSGATRSNSDRTGNWGLLDSSVMAGGKAAMVIFAGRVEAELCQLNFEVPSGSSGEEQLTISTSPTVYVLWVAAGSIA